MYVRRAYAIQGIIFLLLFGVLAWGISKLPARPAPASLPVTSTTSMQITSSAFEEGGMIPKEYTCDGDGRNPELSFVDVPPDAKSLALIVEDPDVPKQVKTDGLFVHWVLFDISPTETGIPEDAWVGIEGQNGAGKTGFVGPCPPPQYEPSTHRYIFELYALDRVLGLSEGATRDQVLEAMQGHVLAQARLIGLYSRK